MCEFLTFEFLRCLFLITLGWVVSICLFPLYLIFSKRFEFLVLFNAHFIVEGVRRSLRPHIKGVFKRVFAIVKSTAENARQLNILEIGAGSGVNFPYYPKGSLVTCVDYNPYYSDLFLDNLLRNRHVTLRIAFVAPAEDMRHVPDGSIDCVVSTYALCAVAFVDVVLQEVSRVLRPGGHLILVEPTAYPEGNWHSILQKLACPLVWMYAGYSINRRLITNLQKADFTNLQTLYFELERTDACFKPHIVAVAVK